MLHNPSVDSRLCRGSEQVVRAIRGSDVSWSKPMPENVADWDRVSGDEPLDERYAGLLLGVAHPLVRHGDVFNSNGSKVGSLCVPRFLAVSDHLINVAVSVDDVMRRNL